MEFEVVGIHAEGRVIGNLALMHFDAAKRFAGKVQEIEQRHAGEPLGAHFDDVRIYCSACIASSASALEALINELFLNPNGRLFKAIPDFENAFWGPPAKWWQFWRRPSGLERKPILEKYRNAFKVMGIKSFTRDEPVYRSAQCLIGLRNYLVHFKPLWDEARRQGDLESQVEAQEFAMSPFLDASASFLDKRCMSGGCAAWAVDTVAAFVQEFSRRTRIDDDKLGPFR